MEGLLAVGEMGLVFRLLVPAIGALSAVAGVFLMKPRAGENGSRSSTRAVSPAMSTQTLVTWWLVARYMSSRS